MYIQLFNPQGLLRGHNLEIGRDADNGGQIRYVRQLLDALADHPKVRRADLFTRLIRDKTVSPDYAEPIETLSPKSRIVRIQCGGLRYRKKEHLWPFLDEFVDKTLRFIKQENDLPNVVHGHYADGNYIAQQLAEILGVVFVASGHSLGRNKKRVLAESGMSESEMDRRFNLSRRIEVEEQVLRSAELVVASTRHEVKHHYGLYTYADAPRYAVIPPGIDPEVFYPFYRMSQPAQSGFASALDEEAYHFVTAEVERFVKEPGKPLVLSVGRADKRKNLEVLLHAFGSDRDLRSMANLAIFAGIRKNITEMDENEQAVLTNLLLLMDRYDLYGSLAIPKKSDPVHEIPAIYRLAAWSKGVFVNPTQGETFGLTLVEAASCGLPIIASPDGGPADIVANCDNGLLVDTSDPDKLAGAIKKIIGDPDLWRRFSKNGAAGVRRHYTWAAHAQTYAAEIDRLARTLDRIEIEEAPDALVAGGIGKRLMQAPHFLITDVDETLIGDEESLAELAGILRNESDHLVLGIATGRNRALSETVSREHDLPGPDIVICAMGTEIYYGPEAILDRGWERHISYAWKREEMAACMARFAGAGLALQEDDAQTPLKLSYYTEKALSADEVAEIHRRLCDERLRYTLVYSKGCYLDLIPVRASKGKALRYLSYKWNTPLSSFLACGNSGNDEDMFRGDVCGLVVGNAEPELDHLRGRRKIHFAERSFAGGIIEGLHYFNFLEAGEAAEPQEGAD